MTFADFYMTAPIAMTALIVWLIAKLLNSAGKITDEIMVIIFYAVLAAIVLDLTII